MDIAVVGGGVGGLAVASLLRDQGHLVTIYDRFLAPEPTGSGLIIQPVGQAVLSDLGVLGAALSNGVKIKTLTGRNHLNGKTALPAEYDPTGDQKFGLGIHRGTLFSLMLKAAQARQITIKTDHMVLGYNDPDAPYLRIEGNRQAGPFDLLVDASGASSQMSPLMARDLDYGALWAVVDLPAGERDLGNCLRQRYMDARKMAGVLPLGTLPGDTTSKAAVFWSLKRSDHAAWREADIADWKAEAAEFWPDFAYLLEQIGAHDDMTFATYSQGSLNRVHSGRVVYIGDAAHRASPQLGQGANMALLDAAILAEAMAEHPTLKALSVYQRRRILHLKTYQLLSRIMTPFYQSDSRLKARIRDRILPGLSKTEWGGKLISRVICGDLVDPFGGRKADAPEVNRVRDILRGPGE